MSTIHKEITVAADPEHAFAVFTERLGEWWPLHTHSISMGRHDAPARSAGFADGQLFETGPGGERYVWGEVTAWEPPERVAYTWRVGRDDELHTDVEVTFTAVDGGTRVIVEHSGWEIWADRADEVRGSYGEGWDMVLEAYAEAT
jgi:uncharacterized protein YndB with AHSA1/START domain